jgi:iron complex outermembrane receptor protein
MKRTAIAWGVLLGLGAVSVSTAEEQEAVQLEEVVVEEAPLATDTTRVQMPAAELDRALPADAGEALRSVVGVSGARMGGHGIDPIIRGQDATRLNILLDGAYIHGGCPNRMDPPTAYSAIESYDEVEVIKGFQSVVYGGGGSGGTVVLTRNTPRFSEDETIRAKGGAGYMSNSDTTNLNADVAAGGTQGFIRGIATYTDAGNYEDGDGNSVRSAYTSKGGTVILGWTPDDHTRLEGSYEATREDDVLFAGAGMDSPMSDSDNYRLKFSRNAMDGVLSGVKAEIYRSDVDHLMDNYSLRPLTAPMKMRVPTTSDTTGGRLSGALDAGNGWQWTLGVDYQRNERDADRFAGPASGGDPTMLQSIMWPEVDLEQSGLFAEALIPVGSADNIKAGLRYDHVSNTADRADERAKTIAGVSTANQLYQAYYGTRAGDHKEDNFSGFLRYEHGIGSGNSLLFGSIARSVRTADATERYLAGNAAPAPNGSFPMRWVGNPDLDPEQHLQLEIGVSWDGGRWGAGASAFYDDVNDYILRDRAHGQAGILRDDNATIYRNVSARLWGLEAEGTMDWSSQWSSRLGLAYVNARNTSDGRWIAQTPPLEGNLSLDYLQASWNLGANLRFSNEQTNVDDDINTGSGRDAGETDGWAALDLYGAWAFNKHAKLDLGVNNVFDKTYAYHVNRANVDPFNPQAIQVNEPGRAFWVKVSAEF